MKVKDLKELLNNYPDNADIAVPRRGYKTWHCNPILRYSNNILYFIT